MASSALPKTALWPRWPLPDVSEHAEHALALGRGDERLAIALTLEDGQAIVMRAQAALEQEVQQTLAAKFPAKVLARHLSVGELRLYLNDEVEHLCGRLQPSGEGAHTTRLAAEAPPVDQRLHHAHAVLLVADGSTRAAAAHRPRRLHAPAARRSAPPAQTQPTAPPGGY